MRVETNWRKHNEKMEMNDINLILLAVALMVSILGSALLMVLGVDFRDVAVFGVSSIITLLILKVWYNLKIRSG